MQQDNGLNLSFYLFIYLFLKVFHSKGIVTNSNVNNGELEVWVWRSNDRGNSKPDN
jgi:hypothetical protein